jgi:hypothetical protein
VYPWKKIHEKMKPTVIQTLNKISETKLDRILDTDYMKRFVYDYYRGNKSIYALQVWSLFVLSYWFISIYPLFQDTKSYTLPGRERRKSVKVK